jgi:hypothetical protein
MNFLKKNMGTLDKTIRISIALVLLGLYIGGNIPEGILTLILIVICAIFLLTSLIGFCPIYSLLNLTTRKHHNSSESTN